MARIHIPAEIAKSSLLLTGLHGMRAVFQRETGVKRIRISTDDKIKAQMDNTKDDTYPYAWLVPSDAQATRDLVNNRNTARVGMRMGTVGATRNTAAVGFLFPVKLGFELKYTDSDAKRLYGMIETFLILSAMTNLNFDVKFANQLVLNNRIEIPDNLTIPIADTGDTTKPGGGEVSIQFIFHTWAGFFRDVASVYAADPQIGVASKGVYGSRENVSDPRMLDADDLFGEYEPVIPEEYSTNEQPSF